MEKIDVHEIDKEWMLTENPSFCMLPWVSMHLTPDGKPLPCCIGSMDHADAIGRKDLSLNEMVNSEFMNELRKDMLAGVKNDMCASCHKTEATGSGMFSFRNTANKKWSQHFRPALRQTYKDGSLARFQMRYFDFRLSNVCNFKCRSCNSGYSTLWAAEDLKQGIDIAIDTFPERNMELLKEVLEHVPYIKEAYFAGGEPLVDEYHYMILEEFLKQDRTDIQLSYNTNLSKLKFKDWNVLEMWSKFDRPVNIYSSIDHCGDKAEYIRHGTKWNVIEKNIKTLMMEPNINLQISTTVTLLNYLTLDDFYKYMLGLGLMPGGDWQLNPAFFPKHFSATHLPKHLREQGKQAVQNIIDYVTSDDELVQKFKAKGYDFNWTVSNIENFPTLVENASGEWTEVSDLFNSETKRLDNIRGENFVETFPELAELYE